MMIVSGRKLFNFNILLLMVQLFFFEVDLTHYLGNLGVVFKLLIVLFSIAVSVKLNSGLLPKVFLSKVFYLFFAFNLYYSITFLYSPDRDVNIIQAISRILVFFQAFQIATHVRFTSSVCAMSIAVPTFLVALTTVFTSIVGYSKPKKKDGVVFLDSLDRYESIFSNPNLVTNAVSYFLFFAIAVIVGSQFFKSTRLKSRYLSQSFLLLMLLPVGMYAASLAGGRNGLIGSIFSLSIVGVYSLVRLFKNSRIVEKFLNFFISASTLIVNYFLAAMTLFSPYFFLPIVLIASNYLTFLTRRDDASGALYDLSTLNSRTLFWPKLISFGEQSLLFGNGLGSAGYFLESLGYPLGHAHNVLVEVFTNSGLVGLTLFTLANVAVLLSLAHIANKGRSVIDFVPLGYFVILTVNYIFQSFAFSGGGLTSTFTIFALLGAYAAKVEAI